MVIEIEIADIVAAIEDNDTLCIEISRDTTQKLFDWLQEQRYVSDRGDYSAQKKDLS
jgi:hypothetical protein